jgi:curved DNA-binding protein
MSGAERITVEAARRILGVDKFCDAAALRAAFNKTVKASHPDHGGSEQALTRTLEAYRVLEAWQGAADASFTAADTGSQRLEISLAVAMKGGKTVTRLADGRRIALTLPAGLRNGDRISAGGEVLSVRSRGRPDAFISGDDLCVTVRTTPAVLREGGRLRIRTPTGSCMVWVPKQIGTNRIVRILGKGLPPRGRHPQGSLIIKLVVGKPGKETGAKSKLKRFASDWAAA